MISTQVQARQAVEALRSGVPSRSSVARLGTTQSAIRERFESALEAVATNAGTKPVVISGGFGMGKSHLLGCMQALAQSHDFVTSYLVVSPETPVGNLHVTLKQLAETAKAPGRTGKALPELMAAQSTNSTNWSDVRVWARSASISDRFRALLLLYEEFPHDLEFRHRVLGDFEGKPIIKTEVRSRLKEIRQIAGYDLTSPRNVLLAPDRLQVLARLYRSCGSKGWVVFIDELERLARFTRRQRVAAYTQLGWWYGIADSESGILPIFSMSDGFSETLLQDEAVLRSSGGSNLYSDESDLALRGIRMVLDNEMPLIPPTSDQLDDIHYKVRELYQEAFDMPLDGGRTSTGIDYRRIREQIRKWITEWDLRRLFPDYQVSIVQEDIAFDQTEYSDDIIGDSDQVDD